MKKDKKYSDAWDERIKAPGKVRTLDPKDFQDRNFVLVERNAPKWPTNKDVDDLIKQMENGLFKGSK